VSFLNRSGPSSVVDVGALLDATAVEYIASIVTGGALVSIGRTRDAGAMSITITVDGEYEREWCRTPEEAADFLRTVDDYVSKRPQAPPSSPRRRKGLSVAP